MHLLAVQRILGQLLALFSLTMLPPLAVSLGYGDGAWRAFADAFLLILIFAGLLWAPAARAVRDLRLREGFFIVAMVWVGLSIFGAVPLMLAKHPHMSLAGAVFETVSGLTTTGATVLTDLGALPPSILFYRQYLQWLGGMGIIVLAVAVLPMLGVGGMQLYRAETPGPMKEQKLTPRIAETAKGLWYIYLALTVVCALAFWLAGMTPFDAIGHSFATLSTGGFSTHDASIGYFHSPLIELISDLFMVLAGMNFSLHFLAWRTRSLRPFAGDSECMTYLGMLAAVAVITSLYLYASGTVPGLLTAFRHGTFQAISITTSTGFTTTGYYAWPSFLPVLLLFASFVGGCGGSTAGGLKVVRVLVLFKQGLREIRRLVHPNAQVPIKLGGTLVSNRIGEAVWGFFATYMATFSIMMLGLMATGLDQVTAFSAMVACMNNMGPGLGAVAANYGGISDTAKWILSGAMLLGRLEVFTVLVVLSPEYWRA